MLNFPNVKHIKWRTAVGIKIISDSTCDLSKELVEKYNIGILPLSIHLGDEVYEDGVNITPDDIYRWSDVNNSTPKTSTPSIMGAISLFENYMSDELICFSISESISNSANVMRLAAQELGIEDRVHVIDTRNLSTGIGLLVIEAALLAEEGRSAREIVSQIEELIPKVRATFVVDTLKYLHRGGRCSSVAALAGSALNLHPKIIVKDGKMQAGKKYRGKMNKVIMSYLKELETDLLNAKHERVFITHSGCPPEILAEVYDYLNQLQVFNEILETRAGGVISSHCGPGTLGVLYIE